MEDKTAGSLRKGDIVTFLPEMEFSGSYVLLEDPKFVNVPDGGSGYHFELDVEGDPLHMDYNCW